MKHKKTGSVASSKTHNFIPRNRNWVVIKRHTPILVKPLIVSLVCIFLWKYVILHLGFSFDKEDENPILFIILMLTSFTYVIFAGYAVNTVLSDYKEISKAVVKNDMNAFLVLRDEQLPILIHLLLGITSLILVGFTMFFPYHSAKVGSASVFSVTYLVILVYVIVTELDDYRNSIWFKEKIPSHWYEIDIEEHFKNEISVS